MHSYGIKTITSRADRDGDSYVRMNENTIIVDLKGLRATDVETVRRALKGAWRPDAEVVAVVGSTARGWRHARSDTDLIVVTPEHPGVRDRRTSSAPRDAVTGYEGPERLEVKYWTRDEVDALIASLSGSMQEDSAMHDLGDEEVTLLERLRHAQPLLGEPVLSAWARRIAASEVGAVVAHRFLDHAAHVFEDFRGCLESGDLDTAVLTGRRAYEYAVDALNASRDEYGLESKWRARRVRILNDEALPFNRFWVMQTMQGFDPAQPDAWCLKVEGAYDSVVRNAHRLLSSGSDRPRPVDLTKYHEAK